MSLRRTLSYALFPFTMWYAIGVRLRNMLFTLGIAKQEAPHITTIGVGNLCTGGSGKTPHVEYLLRMLSSHYRVAVLSRGYRRKSKGYIDDDGSHNPAMLGDEAAMLAAKYPGVHVAVCEKRTLGVKKLMSLPTEAPEGDELAALKPEVIILDDVFQHRHIKPSINILLTEYKRPYFKDHILPYGNLREFRSARYRAGIVVVTKCPEKLNPIERHNITNELRLQNYQKVFFSYLKYGALRSLSGEAADIDLKRIDGVLAVTGIAHADTMIDELRSRCKVQHIAFPDHHEYSRRDIARIKDTFDALSWPRKAIITTEKDAPRLRGMVADMPIYVLPIEVAFHTDGNTDFNSTIESSVRENISFLSKLSIWN